MEYYLSVLSDDGLIKLYTESVITLGLSDLTLFGAKLWEPASGENKLSKEAGSGCPISSNNSCSNLGAVAA